MPPRKSKPMPLLNSIPDADETFITPVNDSTPPLTKREAAKARHVSLKTAAVLLNRDRNTVMKFLDQGCPFVEKADRERGVAWVLDIADVVRWLEERAAKNVADRIGGIEGQITEDEAKRRIAVAKMITEETEAAESIRMVARVHEMLNVIKSDYSEIRTRLMAIPETLSAQANAKYADKVRDQSTELIKNALSALTADKPTEG